MTIYWPGTKIVKSHGNAFDWKGKTSVILSQADVILSNNARIQMMGTKAKANHTFVTKKKNYGPKPLGDL